MSRNIIVIAVLVIILTSCQKYYNCNCTRVVEVVTSVPNAPITTYSTTTTSYTVPVYSTKTKSVSQCGALAGTNGLTTITCTVTN